jgi:hypothetical protein
LVRFGSFDKGETKSPTCVLPQMSRLFCQGQGVISVPVLATIIVTASSDEAESCQLVKTKRMISFADFQMKARCAALD